MMEKSIDKEDTERETFGDQLLNYLGIVTDNIENTVEALEIRLNKVCIDIPEQVCDTEKKDQEYPSYLNHFRNQINRLDYANSRIRKILDSCEI